MARARLVHAVSLWLTACAASPGESGPRSPADVQARVELPGTNVSLVPPPHTRLSGVGTLVRDPAQDVLISVGTAPASRNLEHDPLWRRLFPNGPDAVQISGLGGRLRWRTREANGGAYDGWFLSVTRGDRVLQVQANYQGRDARTFQKLREVVLSVQWRPGDEDPALAFGVTPGTIPGLRLITDGVGGLAYVEGQDARAPGARILFMPGPVVSLERFADACVGAIEVIFQGEAVEPVSIADGPFPGCEASAPTASEPGRTAYVALLATPAGDVIIMNATVETERFAEWSDRFKAASRALTLTR